MRTLYTTDYGEVNVVLGKYAEGSLAVSLVSKSGEPIATLSVWFPESKELPPSHFYLKDWSENHEIAVDAIAGGLIRMVPEIACVRSGHVTSFCYELMEVAK